MAKRIGKYVVTRLLGNGQMGAVYQAKDTDKGREVAIKTLYEHLLHTADGRKRFVNEARAARQLHHENITRLYEVGEVQGRPFLVYELLTGANLRVLLQHQITMSMARRVNIALQIAQGVQYAHEQSIIHRNITTNTIRVMHDGHVKLMEFGFSRIETDARLTHTQVGTPEYMSPEQVLGKTIDYRTDIFSYGMVVYELLTGRHPFRGATLPVTMNNIVQQKPAPINLDNNPDLTRDMQRILFRCLEKDRERRYQGMAEIVAALQRVIHTYNIQTGRKKGVIAIPQDDADSATGGVKKITLVMVLIIILIIIIALILILTDARTLLPPIGLVLA